MKELAIEALTDNLDAVMQFVDAELEAADCPMKIQMQIDLAVEEIFVNIANYAYAPGTGTACIRVDVQPDGSAVSITFIDCGVPYDPLAKEDPDVTLDSEKRDVGGLGIFLVKKMMDDVQYANTDNKNILTLSKSLRPTPKA